jgi:rare lipoprotein A (peptidoglycan hydrolase)
VRLRRVAAYAALTAALALVSIPEGVGSQTVHRTESDQLAFRTVQVAQPSDVETAPLTPDPRERAAANLGPTEVLLEPAPSHALDARPAVEVPSPEAVVTGTWNLDRHLSWYGPGFYGHGTACGYTLTEGLMGVAHRTLPCGTMVTFRNPRNGREITVPVVDRGPYVAGRIWDLTGGACVALDHCWTGPVEWHL